MSIVYQQKFSGRYYSNNMQDIFGKMFLENLILILICALA